tara:strand:+ start:5786 stop:7894 length:2109 start_codon:yes stop_codon:yes gene_type:complete
VLPVKLQLDNFFSHKNSEIDFDRFDSTLLIGNTEGDYRKSNGSGKSAIFESILWCLFNKSRASMMDDIIRWGETTCSVSFEFYHNEKTYKVVRIRNRINSTSNVEFYRKDSAGDWKNISGSTSGSTNSKIESTIKLDYKTFINSVYFRQNDISEFAEADPARKKDILKNIVDISRWDEYEKSSKRKAKDLISKVKILESSIEDYDIVFSEINNISFELKESKGSVGDLSKRKTQLSERLSSLRQKYESKKKSLDTDSYDKAVDSIKKLKEEGAALKRKYENSLSVVGKYKKELATKDLQISEENEKISNMSLDENAESRLEDLSQEILSKKADLKFLKALGEKMEKDHIEGEGKCRVCKQDVSEDLARKIMVEHKRQVVKNKEEHNKTKNLIASLSEKIDEEKSIIKNNKKIRESSFKISQIKSRRDLLSLEIDEKTLELEDIRKSLVSKKDLLNYNKDLLESLKDPDFQRINKLILENKVELENTSNEINQKNILIGTLTERLSNLESKMNEMNSSKKEISKNQKLISVFEKLSKWLGKSGIQTILLDSLIEDLEITSNKILESICNEPSSIVLETQRLGSDGVSIVETLDLKVRKDGFVQNFKSLSGGEKFRISLALRIALSDISSRYGGSSLEFLLLDEVNSPLDRYGVETLFVSVIKSLEDKYKIMVITHDESLKEKFENVINITKINGESEVSFLNG